MPITGHSSPRGRSAADREILAWLADPVRYARLLLRHEGRPLLLDEWQEQYLRDGAKFICILKSRRVGGSWAMTLKMFIRAMLSRSYHGTFISLNLEEATQKIEYALKMHESLPPRFRKKLAAQSRTELVFADARGNRAVLKSIASRAPRGKGGDVGISELPHCREQRAIYEGALHVTGRDPRHQLTIESTPIGKSGVFYDICQGRYPGFSRYEVPWWHCSALCADVAAARREAPMLATRERVARFGTPSMQAIHAAMPEESFRQESELAFIEAAEAAFPLALLNECAVPGFGPHEGAALPFLSLERLPDDSDWRWLAARRKGALFGGYDVGRTRDESVLYLLDRAGAHLEARMAVRLKAAPFAAQEELLARAVKSGVQKICIDATGIGMPLAERMERQFGAAAEGVQFSAPVKGRLVPAARILMMEKKLRLPRERALFAQLLSIERRVSDSGDLLYRAPRGGDGHADMAWALLLACRAAGGGESAAPVYEPVPITKPSRRW